MMHARRECRSDMGRLTCLFDPPRRCLENQCRCRWQSCASCELGVCWANSPNYFAHASQSCLGLLACCSLVGRGLVLCSLACRPPFVHDVCCACIPPPVVCGFSVAVLAGALARRWRGTLERASSLVRLRALRVLFCIGALARRSFETLVFFCLTRSRC